MKPGLPNVLNQPASFTKTGFETTRRARNTTPASVPFPFEVSSSGSGSQLELIAAPGTIGIYSKPELVKSSPADNSWYLVASATINTTTGAITATAIQWTTTIPTDTASTRYAVLAMIEVVDGVAASSEQYNYGPVFVIPVGGVDDSWTLYIQ